ncbi:hypothetical protein B0H10DRAFT_2342263 [Mycena sp. CBHHK59/15]|nr:hypothetical protein B0H10DRAFT_2342263 [Mycena sp. CBHHK59/15]
MSSITLRRCTVERKTGKTMYEHFFEEAQAMGDAVSSAHEIDVTFFHDKPNTRGMSTTTHPTALRSQLTSSPKLGPKPRPYTDANSRSHRMVLALRCPTGAPAGLCSMFQDGAAVYDAPRVSDEQQEVKKGEHFELTERHHVLARLEPTYEIPYTNSSTSSALVLLAGEYQGGSTTGISEKRKVGDTYPPSVLSDHRGPCFAHDKAVVTQRDYANVDGKLIAPAELYSTLVEGTLVLVTVYFATYIMKDQKNDRGEPQPDRKVYHLIVDKLKVLDRGDGEAWDPAVPTMPERPTYSPGASPKKRARDNAIDAAFNNFGKASSPSSSKRQKRNTTGSQ